METIIKEKTIVKKIIIAIVFVLLCNFMCGNLGINIVLADEGIVMEDEDIENMTEEKANGLAEKIARKIEELIFKLILLIPDAVLWILQKSLVSDSDIMWGDIAVIDYSPDIIFSNKVPAFDINFFTPNEYEIDKESSAKVLQNTISSIYKSFRLLAIVALLTILVYVGIRMLLTSIAEDKAKYKKMFIDWLFAIIILFALNYIMSFVIYMTEKLNQIFDKTSVSNILMELPEYGVTYLENRGERDRVVKQDGKFYFKTNFVGYVRSNVEIAVENGVGAKGLAYIIIYIVLVIYIVIFTWQYSKRVLYMAFLTMIAPLVAITYPLDKVSDGKAQGFSMWIKEYIFNALLQPVHYIIYVVVIGSAISLIEENIIYGIVALGFMVPAEKFIRKLFGFEKASTVGGVGAMAGAAALMGAVQKLRHVPHSSKSSGGNNKEKLADSNRNPKIKTIESIPKASEMDANEKSDIKPSGNSKLTQEQNDDLISNGIEPGDAEYYNSLRNNETKKDTEKNRELISTNSSELYNPKRPSIDMNNLFSKQTKSSRFLNGVKAVGGHYKRRISSGIKKAHPVRALRRGLTYGIGAASLGTIGLAAGIASGDAGKTLQYTMAGGMVGGNLGRNLGETTSNVIGVSDAAKAYKAGALGDAYAEKERQKYNRDFKNNVSNYDTAIRTVSNKGWKEMSKDGGIIDNALDYGINDMSAMCNIYKTQQKLMNNGMGEDVAKENAFRAYKLSSQFGDYSSNSKTQENLDKILSSKGYSNQVKDKTKREILNLIKTYKDISND